MKATNVSESSIRGNAIIRLLCLVGNTSSETMRRNVKELKKTKTWREYEGL